ncbi:MAG: hypothetical protein ACE5Z5_00310 [Candidatus Bathyarchaeia archaeon]
MRLGSTVVIKGVDEEAYRNLKGEAVKAGLKVRGGCLPGLQALGSTQVSSEGQGHRQDEEGG